MFLEETGYIVTQAADGSEGLEAFRRRPPDIVLVDLRMPNVDGLQVITAVNAESPDTPLIVVSGTGVVADAVEAVRKGAWDYVTKPIHDMAVLELTVRRALEKGLLIQENRLYQESLEQLVAERTRQLREELAARKEAEDKRAEAEQRFREAQKMEAVGQLASGIAHDFNNILTAIQGNAQLWLMAAKDQGESKHNAEEIVKASQRGADLTKQLLSFARRGKQQTADFDLHETINEVTHLLRHGVDRRIEIVHDLQASPPVISGDPTELHSALLNLGVNARDAMTEGGTLLFATRCVTVPDGDSAQRFWRLAPGEYIEITVSDTGVGMDEHTQARVFEPFFTTKAPGKGTGLGLAAVYGCIESHSGGIGVRSEPGKGTVFEILLPIRPVGHQVVAVPKDEATVTGSGQILVVDDEEIIRNLATAALRSFGYDVLVAADGVEAMACLREHPGEIDLIILDVIMPKMSASETLAGLQEIDPAVRILVSSGFSGGDILTELVEQGAVGILSKPFGIAELSQRVHQAMS